MLCSYLITSSCCKIKFFNNICHIFIINIAFVYSCSKYFQTVSSSTSFTQINRQTYSTQGQLQISKFLKVGQGFDRQMFFVFEVLKLLYFIYYLGSFAYVGSGRYVTHVVLFDSRSSCPLQKCIPCPWIKWRPGKFAWSSDMKSGYS